MVLEPGFWTPLMAMHMCLCPWRVCTGVADQTQHGTNPPQHGEATELNDRQPNVRCLHHDSHPSSVHHTLQAVRDLRCETLLKLRGQGPGK